MNSTGFLAFVFFFLTCAVILSKGASIVKRSTRSDGKKVVRVGDELFLVDDDDDNNRDKSRQKTEDDHQNHKRSSGEEPHHGQVIRVGDQLIVVEKDNGEYNDTAYPVDNHGNKHKRSTGDHEGQIIRVGDQLIVVEKEHDINGDNGNNAYNNGKYHTVAKRAAFKVMSHGQSGESESDINGGKIHEHMIHKRAAIKDESYRWTDKTVPYLFDHTFGPDDQKIVKDAMAEWSKYTCVRFRPARDSDTNKVKFVQGDGCFSFVGMVDKTQDISLDKDGCRFVSTALHEIGHALGMYHTQVRPDRDQFIKVDLSDVADNLKDNFIKQTWKNAHHYGVDYDFKSIMHYDGTSFTSDGGTSIRTLNTKWQKIIGNAKHLSFGDIEMMNKMYHCSPKSCNLKDADCPGTSYVSHSCQCVCPGASSDTEPVVLCSGGKAKANNNHKNSVSGSEGSDKGSDNKGSDKGSDKGTDSSSTSSGGDKWINSGDGWEEMTGNGDWDDQDLYGGDEDNWEIY